MIHNYNHDTAIITGNHSIIICNDSVITITNINFLTPTVATYYTCIAA